MIRSVLLGAVVFVAAACGGGAATVPEAGPAVTSSVVSTTVDAAEPSGSELAGVVFDVRRDPG